MGDRAPPPPPGGPLGPPHLLHNPVGHNVPTLGALDARLKEIKHEKITFKSKRSPR